MADSQRKLTVFNSITMDGYFTDKNGDISWAHANNDNDKEWNDFVSGNASGESTLVFGRITYEMMAAYWPTEQAKQAMPAVAEGMNKSQKIVFSTTMDKADWSNTRLVKSDPVAEIRKLKAQPGNPLTILGSGTIVSLLSSAELIDEYMVVVNPIALGMGRTMFDKMDHLLHFKLINSRVFKNGNVLLHYALDKAK